MKQVSKGSILPANLEAFAEAPRPGVHREHGGRHTLSAKRVIALLIIALAAIGVFVTLPLHRPVWIEAEVVVGAWWALWAVVLSGMLYAGVGLHDDLVVAPETTADGNDRWWHHLGQFDWAPGVHPGDAEGWFIALLVLLLLGVVMLLAIVLTEVVLPLLAPVAYAVLLWMLTRVLHRHPGCHRSLMRALGVGVWWASVYTAPLAFAVFVIHLVL